MADRLIKVREQGRLVLRGMKPFRSGVVLDLDGDEALPLTVDWSDWLGGDTISSVTNEASGPAVSSQSNTTKQASFTVSGTCSGLVEHRITTAAGATKEIRINVHSLSSRYSIETG